MTRRLLICALTMLMSAATLPAQQTDSTVAVIDTVQLLERYKVINDYSMLGVVYGVNLTNPSFNPVRNSEMFMLPVNVGVTYTRYGKLFGYMPYFGFQASLLYTQEGYKFKESKDDSKITDNILGAYKATMQTLELPVMAHLHFDFWKMKLMANVGIYGGYRWKIHREYKDNIPQETRKYSDSFHPNENRWDYGIKGGAGLAFVFDPIEIHLMCYYKYSWSNLHQPNVNARTLEHDEMSKYYYRWTYPTNIVVQLGVHYQLTKRVGRSKASLRRDAREEVIRMLKEAEEKSTVKEAETTAETTAETNEDNNGENR